MNKFPAVVIENPYFASQQNSVGIREKGGIALIEPKNIPNFTILEILDTDIICITCSCIKFLIALSKKFFMQEMKIPSILMVTRYK